MSGVKRGKAYRRELIQNLKVKGKYKLASKSYPAPFNMILSDINTKVTQDTPTAVQGSARRIAKAAKQSQEDSISGLGAISCGTLHNSITITPKASGGLFANYEIGTNISEAYPYYVVHGRGTVYPKKASALRFSRRCGKAVFNNKGKKSSYVFAKRSSPTKPKNYMATADHVLEADIPGIVQEECRSAFSNI